MRIPCTAIACVVLSMAATSRAELLPAGAEFSVSSSDVARGMASMDHFANGNVVAAWIETDGSCCTDVPIKGRIYDADGQAVGAEFPLGILEQSLGTVLVRVVGPGDRFVVFRSYGSPSVAAWRLHDSAGAPLGAEVPVPSTGSVNANDLATDANGNLAMLYTDYGAPDPGIKIQRYTMAGAAVGAATIVAPFALGSANFFGLEEASDGNLIVAWAQNTAGPGNGSPTGWVRRYDTSGATVGSDFAFSGPFDDGSLWGRLETDGAGHFYTSVSFTAGPTSALENDLTVTRFSLDGSNPVEYEFENPDSALRPLSMSATPAGRLVVVWGGFVFAGQGLSLDGYFSPHGWLMQYAADGSPDGPPLPLTDRLFGGALAVDVSVNTNGSAFVGYTITELGPLNPPPADARLQRYCDTDDAGCSLCPAFDDDVDTDGDRIPDGCDPCSNVAGSQNAIVSKASVAALGLEPRRYRVSFDQSFALPAGKSFADLTVVTDGARLRVESRRGQAMFDAVLPGGTYAGKGTRGWTATATKLKYADKTDSPIDGVKRAMIVDQNTKAPGRVRVKARAGGGEYSTYEPFLPMTAIATLGDGTSAAAGICGEFVYTAEQCEDTGFGSHRCLGVAD